MAALSIRLAIVFIILSLTVWVWQDQGHELPIKNLDFILFVIAGIFILIWLIFRIILLFTAIKQKTRKNKCIRCGRRTEPGLIYCKYHLRDAQREAIEKTFDEQ